MGQFKVYQDYSADATLVSNVFIDHYLKDANDAQIKIYLYLLRTLCSHRSCSISDLADQFNYTEKDVQRALRYWEKCGLLALEYSEDKLLCGVRLLDVCSPHSTTSVLAPVVPIPKRVESENIALKVPSENAEPVNEYVKPQYSTDDIVAFKSDEATAEIIFVVEQYLGKPLTPTNIKTLMFFSDELKFSNELIDYLFEYCISRGKKDFRYIEKVAIAWKEEGITTPKQAAKASKKYDRIVYQVMNALGKSSSPTQREADFVSVWSKEYGYSFEIIAKACERAVMATDNHRFEYVDGIIRNWYEAHVATLEDIAAKDELHERERKKRASQSANSSNDTYRQFIHRDYGDMDLLEKEILTN